MLKADLPYVSLGMNAWVAVAFSDDVKVGATVARRVHGTSLIVWRDEKGGAHVQAGLCPHMGAHLAGGWVEDSTLFCPLHHWPFAADGKCLGNDARLATWPTYEQGNVVFVWAGAVGCESTPTSLDWTGEWTHEHSAWRWEGNRQRLVELIAEQARMNDYGAARLELTESQAIAELATPSGTLVRRQLYFTTRDNFTTAVRQQESTRFGLVGDKISCNALLQLLPAWNENSF